MVQERNVGFGFGFMRLPFKGDEVDIELVKKGGYLYGKWIHLNKRTTPSNP